MLLMYTPSERLQRLQTPSCLKRLRFRCSFFGFWLRFRQRKSVGLVGEEGGGVLRGRDYGFRDMGDTISTIFDDKTSYFKLTVLWT